MYNKIFAKLEVCACGAKPQITVDRKNSRFSVVCNFCQYEARAESAEAAVKLWNRVISVPSESNLEIRYNRNHDPKTGRFTSKGGTGGLTSDVDGDKINNEQMLKSRILDGSISTKLDKQKQSSHRKNSVEYNSRIANGEHPSYVTVSNMELQSIINNYAGTGKVYYEIGSKRFKEVVLVDKNFGVFVDPDTFSETETNRGTIHYSASGTHIIPTRRK